MKYQSVSIYKHLIVWSDSITEKPASRNELGWKQRELPRQTLLKLLGCQDWKARTERETHTYDWSMASAHQHKEGFAFAVLFGSQSHQPSPTPILGVAITAVSVWVNTVGAATSTTHTQALRIKPANPQSSLLLERTRLGSDHSLLFLDFPTLSSAV